MAIQKPSKQRNGIQKRGQKYYPRVSVPDPALGIDAETGEFKKRMVRLGSFASMAEAEKARDRARYEAEQGLRIASAPITVEEFFRKWLITHSLTVKASTAYCYSVIVEKYIIPELGALPMAKVKSLHIGEFYSTLLRRGGRFKQGLTPATVHLVKVALRMAFEYAIRVEKVITQDPTQGVKTPKVIHKKNIPWTSDEVKRFLDYVESNQKFKRYKAFFRLSVFTGARNGELLALQWSDLNTQEGRLTISKTRSRGTKSADNGTSTKTGKSRQVYLDTLTIEILKTHKKLQNEERLLAGSLWSDSNFIFTDEIGLPLGDRTPYQILKRTQKLLGLPEQRLHDLRAFTITELLGLGISPHEVSDRVGAKPETLMKHYASVRQERRVLVADQYAELMNKKLQAN